jgi:ribonuclease P protein component
VRYTLQYREKLHVQKDFQQILRSGRKLAHPALFIYIGANRSGRGLRRMGLVTSRKLGLAVDRNRLKRRIREIFRLNKHRLLPNTDLVFTPRSMAMSFNYEQLKSVILSMLAKAKVLDTLE